MEIVGTRESIQFLVYGAIGAFAACIAVDVPVVHVLGWQKALACTMVLGLLVSTLFSLRHSASPRLWIMQASCCFLLIGVGALFGAECFKLLMMILVS